MHACLNNIKVYMQYKIPQKKHLEGFYIVQTCMYRIYFNSKDFNSFTLLL